MENFWSTLKIELVLPASLADAGRSGERDLRLHRRLVQHPTHPKHLGWLSPDEYETAWRTRQSDPMTVHPAPTGAR